MRRMTWVVLVGLAALPARADEAACRKVREVRALAVAERLDEAVFQVLERKHCSSASPSLPLPEGATATCLQVSVLERLSRVVEADGPMAREVGALRVEACAAGASWTPPAAWPSGPGARRDGRWYYPNGQLAGSGSSWSYPNGGRARDGSIWFYPNGQVAARDGSWARPGDAYLGRRPEEVLLWACSRLGPEACALRHARPPEPKEWSPLAILELAWLARER